MDAISIIYYTKQNILGEDGRRVGKNEVMMPMLKLSIFLEEVVFVLFSLFKKEYLVTKNSSLMLSLYS